ncbi:MAG: hypothetical protein JNK05_06050 [Myxococcales bacterium]|nr:hypothetical protein [Myxococcales bacterium]
MRVRFVCFALALAACGPDRTMILVPTDSGVMDVAQDSPAPPADGGRCTRQEDCNDNIACTEETCVVGGVCERIANDRMCPMGQRCFLGRGCASGSSCTRNEDCDDRVACTRDVCGAGGVCQNIRDDSRCPAGDRCSYTLNCVAPGRCGTDPDCDDGRFCNGPERCTGGMCGAGTAPNCADSDMCTADLCNEAMRMCEHVTRNPCGGVVSPGTYTLAPAPSYTCGAGSLNVSQVMLESSASGVVVRGFPVELRGSPPTDGQFTARGETSIGGCQWVFALSGTFLMASEFRGTWTVMFNFCDASRMCFSQFREVTGTRM